MRSKNIINESIQKRNLNLLEHVSYELLQKYGIATPKFAVAKSSQEARSAYERLGIKEVVVKAQVLSGGRQKGHFKKGFKSGVVMANS